MNKRQAEQGFTLLEILIGVALLGGIALGVAKIIDQFQKGQKGVQNNIDFDNLRNSVSLLIRNQTLCSVGLKNAAGTAMAKFSNPVSASESLGTLSLGGSILAQEGKAFGGGLIISKIDLISTGTAPIITPGRKTYVAKLVIEATRGNTTGARTLSNSRNPFLLNITVDNSNKIVTCGGSSPVSEEYPSSCQIYFSHSNNNAPFRSVTLPMNSPGHVGLRLSGDVNGNDRLYIQGYCDNTAGPIDKYIRTCNLGIGFRDNTKNANVNENPQAWGWSSMSAPISSGFRFSGDVNSDDSFYFQMNCPTTNLPELQEAQDYVRNNCYFCFGYSDAFRPQMDTRLCSPVQNLATTKWARFRMSGDVNGDDILFPGFYCKNDAGATVKNIKWD